MESKICKQCNKEFIRTNKNNSNWKSKLFCSKICKNINKYYKNRIKKIEYQREWDKNNKDKKRKYNKKRNNSQRRALHSYSKRNYFDLLFALYDGCQLCKSKDRLEIHHKNYTRDIQDCMLLCQLCHKKIHRKYNKDIILK